ncbi:MAG: MFS transporter [Phototrophicaceae bacterium]
MTTPSLMLSERSNYHHLVLDIGWFAIALAATSRFMQFYAIRMGADAIALNLLTALPAIVLVFSTSLSIWWRSRYEDSVHALSLPSLGYRFIFLLPAFAPFFPIEWRVLWLILSAVLPALVQGMANTIFLVVMRETVSHEQIPSLLARRQFALNIMLLIGVFGFGFLLETLPFPINYQVMFVCAFIFGLVSQWHLTRLQSIVPPHKTKRVEKGAFKRLLKTDEFQSVVLVTMLSYVGYFSVFAVLPLFLERQLGADEGYVALFGVFELIAGAGITLLLDPILRRLGSRTTIAISMFITALAAVAIALAPTLNMALIGALLTGIGWNANNVGIFRFFTERTSANDMSASTIFHQIIFLAMFIGPMLGNVIAMTGISLSGILLIGAILRVLAAIFTHFGLRLFGKRVVRPIAHVESA